MPSRARRVCLVAALCCAAGAAAIAHQRGAGAGTPPGAAEGTAAVSGVVIDATDRTPIPGVMVYLGFQGRGAVGRLSRQLSDDQGRFVFTDLPAGNNYFINASKPGYLDGHYGVGAGGLLGGLISLADGQWFREATIVMQRTSSIGGTVLDEQGGPAVGVFVRVLARIRVAGREQFAAGLTTRSDDRGRYRLAGLMPGRYIVHVPFVQQSIPSSFTPAELAGLTPEQIAAGRAAPDPPPAIDLAAASRLIVGRYLVPPPDGNRLRAYVPLFYPSVAAPSDATVIPLAPGEQREGIDIALRAVPATSVSGTLHAPPDALSGMVVRLLPEGLEDLGAGSAVATTMADAEGRFTLINVPGGTYTLDVRRTLSELEYQPSLASDVPLPSTPGAAGSGGTGSIQSGPTGTRYSVRAGRGSHAWFGRMKIVVGPSPLTGVGVTLQRGVVIRGRLVTETGEPAQLASPTAPIYAQPADGNLGSGMLAGTRPTPTTFEIEGLRPAPYLLRFAGLGSYRVKSIMADGVDHNVTPFDGAGGRDFDVVVTLTEQRTDLSGTAADARGAQVPNAIVIAFPVAQRLWTNYGLTPTHIRDTPTTSSGTYRISSLPAGDYYVVAVPPEQADVWQDPANLAKLAPLAARVSLDWGDVRTQPVTVVRLK